MLATPRAALVTGAVLAVTAVGTLVAAGLGDAATLATVATRVLHVGGAAVWLGLIWFVNFIQLPLLAAAADAERAVVVRLVVPRVAATFRAAAHLTLASGLALAALLPHAPLADPRTLALLASAAMGIAMWAIVEFGIRPRVAILTGAAPAEAPARAAAALAIRTLARVNLILSVPVTGVMVAVAHLH